MNRILSGSKTTIVYGSNSSYAPRKHNNNVFYKPRPKNQRTCIGCYLKKGTHEKNLIKIDEKTCLCNSCFLLNCKNAGIKPPANTESFDAVIKLIAQKWHKIKKSSTVDQNQFNSINFFYRMLTGEKIPTFF